MHPPTPAPDSQFLLGGGVSGSQLKQTFLLPTQKSRKKRWKGKKTCPQRYAVFQWFPVKNGNAAHIAFLKIFQIWGGIEYSYLFFDCSDLKFLSLYTYSSHRITQHTVAGAHFHQNDVLHIFLSGPLELGYLSIRLRLSLRNVTFL